MSDFLRVFGRKPSKTAKKEWLQAEIDGIIEDNKTLDLLISIIKDKDYETKVFVEDAILAGAIIKTGKTRYSLPGGDLIGSTLEEAIDYLNDPRNNDVLLNIKALTNSK